MSVSSKQEVVIRGMSRFPAVDPMPGPGPRTSGMPAGGTWAGEPGMEAAVRGKAVAGLGGTGA